MSRRLESGLPLGGIGAGKIEFCADGRFTNVTTNNNWDAPIVDGAARCPAAPRMKEGFPGSIAENAARRMSILSPEGLPGAWLAIFTPAHGATVLKTVARPAMSTIAQDDISFHGVFPRATVQYGGLDPLRVTLEAFSPLELGDSSPGYQNASLPLALFHFELHNTRPDPVPVTLAFSWQNLSGIGGYPWSPINSPDAAIPEFRDEAMPGLWFGHVEGAQYDRRVLGDFSLRGWTDAADARISHCAGWNPAGDGHDVWDSLAQSGHLSNETLGSTAARAGRAFRAGR